MSTYSPNLRIELITTGDQVGTWGTTTNTNLGTLLEDAIAGYTSVSVTTANQALTANNGSADQSRNVSLALTTTTTAAFAVYAPPAEKTYVIYNASSYTATIYNSTVLGNTTAAGNGVAIPAGKTVTVWSDGTDFRFQNNHLSSLTLTTDLAVADGGTGASTAADARTNLGLGTIATQNSSSVSITGGSITGITDLAVADGGTGASTAANARTNLGLVIGTDVQAYNAGLQDISGLAKTDGNLIVGNGTNWVAESGATARTSLGLGSMATQNSNAVTITGGSISGITDLAVADGGTGSSTASGARSNLGAAASGANSDITALSGLTTALSVAQGGTGGTTSTGSGAVVLASSPSIASPTLTGTPVAPTAAQGTNTTQVATTAFVLANGAPTGGLLMWPTSSAPSGWLVCNGQAVSRSTYSALYAVVGTTFGAGDGSTTFNLPDYRDRMPIGAGTTYAANSTGGSKDATLVSHSHTTDGAGAFSGTVSGGNGTGDFGSFKSSTGVITLSGSAPNRPQGSAGGGSSYTASIDVSNHTHTVSTEGSSATNANLPPYLGIYFIIKT